MSEQLFTLILLLFPSAVQVIYHLVIYGRFLFSAEKAAANKSDAIPISVLVCGRNEEENFKRFLPKLLEQEYPEYEVITINDQSTDNTKDLLEALQSQYPHLRIVDVKANERFWQGKKYGLTLGIKAAAHEHLLFTDADCEPASNQWIAQMAAGFAKPDQQIVLGFGAYQRMRGLLNMIIRYETLQTAIQYFSMAAWKLPYMGVGRNLAYTKTLFFQQKGFAAHMHVPMGDDDLFVNAAATSTNTSSVCLKEAFTYSIPETKFKAWFHQKRRHLAASGKYNLRSKLLLGLYGGTTVLYYLSIVGAIFLPVPLWVWYVLALRMLVQYLTFILGAKKTGDWDLLLLLPFLELFLLVNQVFIIFANRVNKRYRWK